jgi:hypothetical protein
LRLTDFVNAGLARGIQLPRVLEVKLMKLYRETEKFDSNAKYECGGIGRKNVMVSRYAGVLKSNVGWLSHFCAKGISER